MAKSIVFKLAYRHYLKSPAWRVLRARQLQRSPVCEACGSPYRLHVHHVRYRKAWQDSRVEDLQTLCKRCHDRKHPRPTKQTRRRRAATPKVSALAGKRDMSPRLVRR